MAMSFYAECRPNLKACNVYVKSSAMLESPSVLIEDSRIVIELSPYDKCSLTLPDKAVSLVPGSLSGFAHTDDSLNFRCQINHFSLLDGGKVDNYIYCPDFKVHEKVSLFCAFCFEPLSDKNGFNRVLPLPSTEEFDNFFCHHHSADSGLLDPKHSDFFYNPFFYKIHSSKLSINHIMNRLKCPKCSTMLGEVSENSAKLWSSCVYVSQTLKETLKSPLEMHLDSLKSAVSDLPVQMNKFVFTCRLEGANTHYILLWIVDRNLTVLSGRRHSVEKDVHFAVGKVMKVLYSFHEEETDEVNEWLKSFSTSIVPIPPRIEVEFLKYLENTSENIPINFKNVNGMNVSYIQLDEVF